MRRVPLSDVSRSAVGAIILAIVTITAACSAGTEWAGTVEERDGVTYVSNPADGLWQNRAAAPIRFELEQTYGAEAEPAEAILAPIRFAAIDADANLYVLDRQAARIVSFAPDGVLRWSAGSEGEGPGELSRPAGMAIQGNTLMLLNRSSTSLDSWDTAGNFVDSRSIADLELGVVFLAGLIEPDTMVFANSLMGQTGVGVTLVRWGESPQLVSRFAFNALPGRSLGQNFWMAVAADVQGDLVSIGGNTLYAFRLHDRNGNLLSVVSRDVDYLKPAGTYTTDTGSMMSGFGGVGAPVLLPGGYWITYVSWPSNVGDPNVAVSMMATSEFTVEWMSSLDLFDPEGRFLYSSITEGSLTPDIGRPLFVDAGGKLYTQLSDPFPQLRRYRVVIEE